MAACPDQPHQPTRALQAPCGQQGNLPPLSPVTIEKVYTFFHPNFTSFSPSLSPEKDEPEDVTSCPMLSPEPAVRLVPFAGLAYVCSDEAEQK